MLRVACWWEGWARSASMMRMFSTELQLRQEWIFVGLNGDTLTA
jgi:hypothetical protein